MSDFKIAKPYVRTLIAILLAMSKGHTYLDATGIETAYKVADIFLARLEKDLQARETEQP